MLTIQSNRDLEQFGIVMLTGESCAYSKRILCDLTQTGYHIFCKCFGLQPIYPRPEVPSERISFPFAEAWNSNSKRSILTHYFERSDGESDHKKQTEPHILSVMLPYNAYEFLGFWCLEQLTGIHTVIEVNQKDMLSNARCLTYNDWVDTECRISEQQLARYNHIIAHHITDKSTIGLCYWDDNALKSAGLDNNEFTKDFYACLKSCGKVYNVKKSGVYGSDRNQHQMSGRVAWWVVRVTTN